MKESTKRLICIVSVVSIFVAMTIGIVIYKLRKEELPKLGIEIQKEITINRGETRRIGYNLYIEEAMVEATSSDNSILLIKEIRDKNIVVTAKENGEVTLTVKAIYKGERREKEVAVTITEEVNTNEKEEYEIGIEECRNFVLEDNIICIQNKGQISFVITIKNEDKRIPRENKTEISFDKEIDAKIRGQNVVLYPTEDCIMTIMVEIASINYKEIKEYIIKVE